MAKPISVLYSFRDRSLEMVKITLDSLENQSYRDFEVVFVDYGSVPSHAEEVKKLVEGYQFARFIGVPVYGKLWSRSKALNIGIKQALNDLIFIVDIDLFFAKNALDVVGKNFEPGTYLSSEWFFLSKNDTQKFLKSPPDFVPVDSKKSDDNGMVMIEKKSLEAICGYDEFFHLYGGEDTDLKLRLEKSGISKRVIDQKNLFFHIWHPHVIQKRPKNLVYQPYVFNIKRINEKHVFYNQDRRSIIPLGQETWGELHISDLELSQARKVQLPNIHSRISHFFNVELPRCTGQVVEIEVTEDPKYKAIKTRVKALLKGNSEPYMSMNEINEFITEKLIFCYSRHHYAYFVDPKSLSITLKIRI